MSFSELGLSGPVLKAVEAKGYDIATPIQLQAIPPVLAGGDLVGCAQTGTGKTAAFALPTLERLHASDIDRPRAPRSSGAPRGQRVKCPPIRCLVLAPTRELAAQILASFQKYGKFTKLRCAVAFGGVGQGPQVRALQQGVDIMIATPGRLLDLKNQGYVDLSQVEVLILDEADQMLDMGFLPDLRRIVGATPTTRQTLMFSATMPPAIEELAAQWLRDPARIDVVPQSTPAERVEQRVYFVESRNKPRLLTHYLNTSGCGRTLVFARTKHGADKIVKHLEQSGIRAAAIHGNKSQGARTRTLEQFRSQRPPVLVATDIAARGLDINGVTHVINYELPEVPETYVHRIGRTARAGASGAAALFCGGEERGHLRSIERLTRTKIDVEANHPEAAVFAKEAASAGGSGRSRSGKGPAGPKGTGNAKPSPWRGKKKGANAGPSSFGKKRRPFGKKPGGAPSAGKKPVAHAAAK